MAWLKAQILTYWLTGTGGGGGFAHDMVQIDDRLGLPYLPAKHLKGLIRDAIDRVAHWSGQSSPATSLLGDEGDAPGLIEMRDARLSPALGAALEQAGNQSALFRTLRQTAMENGVAKQYSLRSSRVAIPMVLLGEIEASPDAVTLSANDAVLANAFQSWQTTFREALPLVRAVGSGRMHGLGRVVLTLEDGGETN